MLNEEEDVHLALWAILQLHMQQGRRPEGLGGA